MKVFVAGATGAVGRRLIPRLVARGHSVAGLTHNPQKSELVRNLGAEPLVASGLDGEAIRATVAAAAPDVVVHEMTDLKGASDMRKFDRLFAMSNRLRTEGTDHLMAAARAAGVKRVVAQSYCGWPYAGTVVRSRRRPIPSIRSLPMSFAGPSTPSGTWKQPWPKLGI